MTDPVAELRRALRTRYDLQGELGRGGMSIVVRARDLRHNRDVAVKILRAEFSAALGSDRFLREIQIAARLQHPHILPLYDSGEEARIHYFVMPCVEGETLRQRLSHEHGIPIGEALRIAREIGSALAYAHAQGIVHRDIKPENILLSSGLAIVADFGIARAQLAAVGDRVTDSGVAVGTPGYMSPEQAGGEQQLDGRSDIYSLGCVLFEMLAGEPPFTGPTPKAVVARHMQQPPPALHIVRPTVSHQLEQVINRALAKVPADRYATADQFVEALAEAERPGVAPAPTNRTIRTLGAAAAIAALAIVAWLGFGGKAAIDDKKIVVFPLAERGIPRADSGVGYDLALVIEAALEHTDPLKWIDGWQRLDARQRANVGLVTPDAARALTLARGARYYLDGIARSDVDSASVTLRLTDATGDSLVAQETINAPVSQPLYQLGLAAVLKLLPKILDPGRRVDLAALTDRKPGAVALFIQGERNYREARFLQALDLYRRAVGLDSMLAFAAVKGAQAASWANHLGEAEQLARAAVSHPSALTPRYAHFAQGLLAYVRGQADSAVYWLEKARSVAPDWNEASMALGEVFYHLVPSHVTLDTLAEGAFKRAIAVDSEFTPALFHLTELAIRRSDLGEAARLIQRFQNAEPDSSFVRNLALQLACVRRGAIDPEWQLTAQSDPGVVLLAAEGLSVGLAHPACAEQAFRAVLATSASSINQRWGALLGLNGLLVALGRDRDVVTMIDSAAAHGMPIAPVLYVLDVIAGAKVERQATALQAFASRSFGATYQEVQTPQLIWLLGTWHAHLRDQKTVETLQTMLAARAAQNGDRRTRLFAQALDAQRLALRGDTAGAMHALGELRATAPRDSLEWEFGESLPVERLLLAQLLLQHGRPEDAFNVAASFDHPAAIINVLFVPVSLEIRARAAEALNRRDWASAARNRLTALGRGDLLDGRVASLTQEVPHVVALSGPGRGTSGRVNGHGLHR